jgi:hypothetical protein
MKNDVYIFNEHFSVFGRDAQIRLDQIAIDYYEFALEVRVRFVDVLEKLCFNQTF